MTGNSFTRDGVSYSITVTKGRGVFTAVWTCDKCKVTGPPTQPCPDAEDAKGRAQARAFSEHHFDRHVVVPVRAIRQVATSF